MIISILVWIAVWMVVSLNELGQIRHTVLEDAKFRIYDIDVFIYICSCIPEPYYLRHCSRVEAGLCSLL